MPTPHLTSLIEKYLAGTATPAERQEVLDWYRSMDHREIRIPLESAGEMEERRERMLLALQSHVGAARPGVVPVYRRMAGVAAVLLLLASGFWVWRQSHAVPAPLAAGRPAGPLQDALPGHNGAILTLADGSTKVLDSLGNGQVAKQGGTVVTLRDGQLDYVPAPSTMPSAMTYNTMTTPRGRQYQLVLPDGTRVWLNAASSLTYPTAFTGADRTVVLKGEAYFEVEHSPKPFRVRAGGQLIRDLGTRFNVNAYDDEPATATTLLEGAVSVNGKLMRPGQQAVSTTTGGVTVSEANVEQAVAWKNGAFSFTDASLPVVLRQLARWYAVDIDYRGPVPEKVFSGEIGRSLTLSQVLRVLTRSHISYRIENGNKLIILPGE